MLGGPSVHQKFLDPDMPFLVNEAPMVSGDRLREIALGDVLSDAEQDYGRSAATMLMRGIERSGVLAQVV